MKNKEKYASEIVEIALKAGIVALIDNKPVYCSAIRNGRNFIGFELDKHYCDIANERIAQNQI